MELGPRLHGLTLQHYTDVEVLAAMEMDWAGMLPPWFLMNPWLM